jgi:hypothetical protein
VKKIIISILFVLCFVGISFSQTIPNLEVSTLLSCKNFTLSAGVTSRIMSFKDVDLRIGYVSGNKWVMGLSYDLDNLDDIADVEYAWEDTLLATLLVWAGLDFDTGEYDYGVSMILVSVNF